MWLHLGLLLLGDRAADGYASAETGVPSPFRRTVSLLTDGNLVSAFAWSCLARASEPGQGAVLMARVQIRRNQTESARSILATAAGIVGKNEMAKVMAAHKDVLYADALVNTGRTLEAIAAYDRAIALSPDSSSLRFEKGRLLFGLSRFDEARAEFGDISRFQPDEVLGAAVMLAAIAWRYDAEQAKEHLRTALSTPQERTASLMCAFYRAIALAGLDRCDDAIAELEVAVHDFPTQELPFSDTVRVLFERFRQPLLPTLETLFRSLPGWIELTSDS